MFRSDFNVNPGPVWRTADDFFKEGFKEIKGRFGKITAFFAITWAIKGIFRQIGRGVNKLGTAVGGQVGDTVTSAIDSAIQVLIGYLCDCCLGWILYRQEVNSFKEALTDKKSKFFMSKTILCEEVMQDLTEDTLVFIKGSRGMKLDEIYDEMITIDKIKKGTI